MPGAARECPGVHRAQSALGLIVFLSLKLTLRVENGAALSVGCQQLTWRRVPWCPQPVLSFSLLPLVSAISTAVNNKDPTESPPARAKGGKEQQ